MRRPGGVTTAQIQKLTGMQQHSARALISSITVGKDEKIIKTKEDGATVYSIVAKTRAAA